MSVNSIEQGLANRSNPVVVSDNSLVTAHMSNYGDALVRQNLNLRHQVADEGAYFVAVNTTIGTGIAMTTSITGYAETAGAVGVMFFLRNLNTVKRIYMDYLKCKVTAVPTSATHWDYVCAVDNNPLRYTSGGSVITPVCANGMATSNVTLMFGALTTAVPANRRIVANGRLRNAIPVVLDSFTIIFGGEPSTAMAQLNANAAKYTDSCAPVILMPGENLCITMWGTSNAAAPAFEFETGYVEK